MNDLQLYKENEFVPALEAFTKRLNQEPEKAWLKKTPDGKAEYIPVGIIEMQLRQDFAGLVKYQILSERRELNEYVVTARICVFHPIIRQWLDYDGIGAKVITQKANTDLNDFTIYKQKNALEMNAPNAYSEAIKNAAKKLGKKYGADLNRKHEDEYTPIYTEEAEVNLFVDQVEEKVKVCNSEDELKMLWDSIPEDKQPVVKKHFSYRRTQLKNQAA